MPHTSIPLSQLKIGFIGAGRLGRALAWSLDTAGCRVHAVASRGAERAAEFAAPIAHCAQYPAQQLADECDLVFITTPDATIQAVADGIRWRAGQGVVHCSGATEVAVLAKAAADGALTGGFHPMQTFADPAAAARSLPGSTITIEAQGELNGILLALVERLGCAANQLPAGARARYHAAAGYASQYIEAAGVAKGMPGPVSRGDAGTVEKHLAALGELDDDTLRLYRDLCLRSVSLAFAAGGIDADKAARIEGILRAV
jgi:predicted short-subunit dehydrogenase-like oxidoreductase (DUF2520 family)